MKVKAVVLALSVALFVGVTWLLPVPAKAQDSFQQKGLAYKLIGQDSVAVKKISDKNTPKGKLVIPATVKHDGHTYKVVAVDSWGFFGCKDITEVSLPSSVSVVDIWAFTNCSKLKEMTFPPTVKRIGYSALESCESLTQVTLPPGLTAVPERMFQECKSLKHIDLPASVTAIGSCAFKECKALETINMPADITNIGSYAFSQCESLRTITLPASLKKLGGKAFSSCDALESVVIPEGLTDLGEAAFGYCKHLSSVTLPASLDYSYGNPFIYCPAMTSIQLAPGGTTMTIKDGILYSADMTQVIACPVNLDLGDYVLPATVKTIKPYAFYECRGLTGISMTQVETIGESAFYCTGLKRVSFGGSLTEVGKHAFYFSRGITELDLPSTLERVGVGAFSGISKLTKVSFDERLLNEKNQYMFNNSTFGDEAAHAVFTVRQADGKSRNITYNDLPDAKKLYRFIEE